jgi:hypothetical protein
MAYGAQLQHIDVRRQEYDQRTKTGPEAHQQEDVIDMNLAPETVPEQHQRGFGCDAYGEIQSVGSESRIESLRCGVIDTRKVLADDTPIKGTVM